MLRSLILLLLLNSFLNVHGQKTFTISGTIDNSIDSTLSVTGPLKNGGYIYLEYSNGVTDSALIEDNKFSFEDILENPEVASIGFSHGGLAVLLSYNSKYDVEFVLFSPENKLYEYRSNLVMTDSHFHNSWSEIGRRSSALEKERMELQTVSDDTRFNESEEEIQSINNSLRALYASIIKEDSLLTLEKAFLLMGDPDFSHEKYKEFYSQLSILEKEATIGKLFKKKLDSFQP